MADDPLRRQAVPLQDVLQQWNQPVNLCLIPGLPVAPLWGITVAGVHYLDADGAGVEPGTALPAAVTGMPGAAALIYQAVDGRRVGIDQVMAADFAQRQGIARPGRIRGGVMQYHVLHTAILPARSQGGVIDHQAAAAADQRQTDQHQPGERTNRAQ